MPILRTSHETRRGGPFHPIRTLLTRSLCLRLLWLSVPVAGASWARAADAPQTLLDRKEVSLDGEWKTIIDPYETGYYDYRWQPYDQQHAPPPAAYFMDAKPRSSADLVEYDFDASASLRVPGDWNTQRRELFYYEGSVWYRRTFTSGLLQHGSRAFLRFGAANYGADVYLNGRKLGTHIGGFTPFSFEVTEALEAGDNTIVVRVDNRRTADAVPTLDTDWWNYGGLTRDVRLVTAMIGRDCERACVILWSLANETPVSEARTAFLRRLAVRARALDPTRLLGAAMEKRPKPGDPDTQIVDDPLSDSVDVMSFNEYVGWYDGTPEKCDRVRWEIHSDKPVIVSEFGGDALQGRHGTRDDRWTEEYQAYLYERNLAMLDRIPGLSGMSPWVLVDFRSPRRVLPGIEDGFNRKGLVSSDGLKKAAFFVLQKYYSERAAAIH